jgi:hypothetical protein
VASTDEDLAGARSFLETLRDVDGVSRDEQLAAGAVAGHDLAGVHADADADPHSQLALEVLVEAGERDAQLRRGAHGSQRIVLVQFWEPEDGHHRVADELLQRPSVALEHRADGGEVARHDLTERFRVEALAERRRVRDVRKDNGDRAAADGHVRSVGRSSGRA